MLELKRISKVFPGVKALDDVSLQFYPGEIHAVVGENGAGKSTLMKIICGIYFPDGGEVSIDGKVVNFTSYKDAIDHQINIVNQEIQVIPKATIAENIFLDKIESYTKGRKINWDEINESARKYLDMVGLDLEPTEIIGKLSAGYKQLIQIAKALSADAKILILDEPTSALTQHEADNLIKILKKLREDGINIIYISHKLEEVLELSDKVSVLRDGKYIDTKNANEITKDDIVKMMIGRETKDEHRGFLDISPDEIVLELCGVGQEGCFDNINFSLNKGEILGFYGLVGSGRTELAKIIIGEDEKTSGNIFVNGKKAEINSMCECLEKYKVGYVSENRKEEGLILSKSIKTNTAITVWEKITKGFSKSICLKSEEDVANEMIEKLQIRTPDCDQLIVNLSGGNQQKVSIAKWLAAGCDILIIDEPTIGVDIGAKEYIHELIWKLAKEEGKSIILISSDMPEMISLARRILVFKDNEIVGELNGLNEHESTYDEVSKEIGRYLA